PGCLPGRPKWYNEGRVPGRLDPQETWMSALHRTFLSFVLLSATGACSGAEAQDVLADQTGAASSSGTSGEPSGETSGTTPGGTASDGSSSGSASDCPREEEPNDDRRSANQLAPTRCG